MSKGRRYVLYKADEWSYPVLWQWYCVKEEGWGQYLGNGFFPSLLSSLNDWECLYDADPAATKVENMKYIIGFETEEDALNYGKKRSWVKSSKVIC